MSSAEPRDASDRLDRIAALAGAMGASAVERAARQWIQRVADGLFYVACVGQFKRGKSTLLNALVGGDLLPMGVVPVTAVVTVLRHGPSGARVHFLDDGAVRIEPASLASYVSEVENPENKKGVSFVEVFAESPLLASGMCLVDTPGLGSVFLSSDARTRAFLPHIDAALVVLGPDPPISAEELDLVRALSAHVRDFVFVLNKSDRLSGEERDAARAFSERVLSEALGRSAGPLFEVSAVERLRGTGLERDFEALAGRLGSLAEGSGVALRRGAAERGLERLAHQLRKEVETRRRVLLEPQQASERRIAELRECASEAERSLQDLAYLFQGEQDRIARELSEHRALFLAQELPRAHAALAARLDEPTGSRLGLRSQACRVAVQVAGEALERWRVEEEPIVERLYHKACARFVELANQFLVRLARSRDPAFESLPEAIVPETALHGRQRFHFQALEWLARPRPWERLLDVVSPRPVLRRRVEAGMRRYLEELFEMTATRIQSDLAERVLESRRRLEAELRAHLGEIHGSAQRALVRARAVRAGGAAAIEGELEGLTRFERDLSEIAGTAPAIP